MLGDHHMKKLIVIIILCFGLLVPGALSWGASRSISENTITIAIANTDATGCIIRETIPDSLTVASYDPISGGNYKPDKDFLKWIFTACSPNVS